MKSWNKCGPLTPKCVELFGEQSPCPPVSGVPAAESNGGIWQNCFLLWRRQQSHQHGGLLWNLCRVHKKVWGQQESYYFGLLLLFFYLLMNVCVCFLHRELSVIIRLQKTQRAPAALVWPPHWTGNTHIYNTVHLEIHRDLHRWAVHCVYIYLCKHL